jgi:hypothetical protein
MKEEEKKESGNEEAKRKTPKMVQSTLRFGRKEDAKLEDLVPRKRARYDDEGEDEWGHLNSLLNNYSLSMIFFLYNII